ncbi:hypothetical protein SO802_019623 [Lithocarpus litseifolius]|uniref:Thaumatin-like protein n=1 Tax=Lithocarpus litseifolius TaxID=425828 RepID=A0AAW2CU62_9ROSI
MNPFKNLSISFFYFFFILFIAFAHAARFDITNNCNFTIWAAAVPVGGGRQINKAGIWSLEVSRKSRLFGIWARTGCSFDGSGRGSCQTGDCDGLLHCKNYGKPPFTLAEFTLNLDLDFFDVSVGFGFNVPMAFSPTNSECTGTDCTSDLNGLCPKELKVPSGCNSPCTVFKTDKYCCTSSSNTPQSCPLTNYSIILKGACPGAVSYSYDSKLNTYSCPSGNNYKVVFCPGPL